MAIVLPFPPARRVDLVRRQADRAAAMSEDAGERHIQRQVELQREALVRKGCDPERVQAECYAFETAIRVQLWNVILYGNGGAA